MVQQMVMKEKKSNHTLVHSDEKRDKTNKNERNELEAFNRNILNIFHMAF